MGRLRFETWLGSLIALMFLGLHGSSPVSAETQRRVALLIGNSTYDPAIGVLANPVNDVTDLRAKLAGELRFEVKLLLNASAAQMRTAISEFGASLGRNDVALFFYGGHGVAVNGRNYLLPADTPKSLVAADEGQLLQTLDDTLIKLDDVLSVLQKSKVGLVFLDSCRNPPGGEGRSANVDFRVGSRMASIIRGNIKAATSNATAPGTFRAYATDPGNIASDGSGRNSPFVASLLKHIVTPGETVDEIMRRVRADVVKETSSRQVPWTEDLLTERFILFPRAFTSTGDRNQQTIDPGPRQKASASQGGSNQRNNGGGVQKRPLDQLPPGLGAGAGAGL